MPVTCIVIGCGSRSNRDEVHFYSVPAITNYRFLTNKNDLSRKRRALWLAAINRSDLTESKIKNQKVCSKHFLTGKPACLEDESNSDWVPLQNMGYIPEIVLKQEKDDQIYEQVKKRIKLEPSDEWDVPVHNVSITSFDKESLYYEMNCKKQGHAYIFNHYTFEDKKNKDRIGTDIDGKKLIDCLLNLNFSVHKFKDLRKKDIEKHISDATKVDHTDNNCLFIAVLSHGDNGLIHAFDTPYDPSEMFWNKFTPDKCPSLAGKPKLFLLQCCQGYKTDQGIWMQQRPYKTQTDGIDPVPIYSYRIPLNADLLIMYASMEGYYAFRNDTRGSYYIEALCDELNKLADKENILTILTIVNRRVALDFQSNAKNPELHDKKQIPYFKSSLIRLLKFGNLKGVDK